MTDNDGYVYVGLSRCKSFDHFIEPQCFHCYLINHFTGECPDEDMPATCDKCAGSHKTKDCNRNSLVKCVNCVHNCERNFNHNAFSHDFPAMVYVGAFVLRKIHLDGEKKRITELAKNNFLNLSLLNVHSVRNKCFHL